MTNRTHAHNLTTHTIVDELGLIKADIAKLVAREKQLKDELINRASDSGLPERFQGGMYDASVSCAERASLDMDAVRAKLSPQFIAAHTRMIPVTTVRVTARLRDAA